MLRYFRLLLIQLRASSQMAMAYRVEFFFQGLTALFWSATTFVPLSVAFHRDAPIPGWTFDEALVVLGLFLVLKSILQGAVNPSLLTVVDHIRHGTLDFVLLKPADAQFLVSTAKFDPSSVVGFVMSGALLVTAFVRLGRCPSPGHVLLALMLMSLAVAVIYSLWILVVSAAFYVVRVDNLSYLLTSISRCGALAVDSVSRHAAHPVYVHHSAGAHDDLPGGSAARSVSGLRPPRRDGWYGVVHGGRTDGVGGFAGAVYECQFVGLVLLDWHDTGLVSLDDAVSLVLRECRPLGPEPAQLLEAYGRVLATPLKAPFPIPRERASLMDGYAVRSHETGAGASLTVAFDIPAGRVAPRALAEGECARILTGAPIPEGADAVVKQEDVSREGDRITLRGSIAAGDHIRTAGSDALAGAVLIDAGTVMDAGALALAATTGVGSMAVVKRPVVAILATGDELRSVGDPLEAGTIYESNSYGLWAQAREAGGLPAMLGRVRDDPAAIVAALTSTRSDICVTSGGASVGDFDFAREVLTRLGGRKVFWQVAIRPGRPVLFGVIEHRTPTLFFALPGNPAASALTFDLLIRPAIRALTNCQPFRRPRLRARLEKGLRKPRGLTFLARGALVASGEALVFRPAALQGSMSIPSLKGLSAVAIVPPDCESLEAGEQVEVEQWGPIEPA